MKNKLIYFFAVLLLVIVISVFWVFTNTKDLTVNGYKMTVYIANNPIERMLGLSWRNEELATDGMLFKYSSAKERTYWMRGMKFDLDIIWIKNGKITGLEANVPAPQDGQEPRRMYSGPLGADAVLELPAGGISEYGLVVGQQIDIK
ncbi:DUF192 domain-containing protein [Patescibacteria group bacterium]|nr:DUF192 domain-containing protein [Patescibacteria group bacterium]